MKELTAKQQIAALKKEMKQLGIRRISFMNPGLTREESYYNQELFRLNTQLEKEQKAQID